jgi:drug/metabolite transporter (DMT)-like permease
LVIGIDAKCNGLKILLPQDRGDEDEFEMTIQNVEKADGATLDRGAGRVSSTYNMIGVLLAAAGAVAFSLRTIFVKLAYQDMSDPATLLALRMMFSLPFFVIAIWLHRRHAADRSRLRITGRDALLLTGLGFIGDYLSSLLDMTGLQFVAAGIGRLLLFIYPTIVVIISAVFLKKPISGREVGALAITYVGVGLVLSGQFDRTSENFWLGASLIVLGAISFSVYLVVGAETVKRLGSIPFTAYASAAAAGFCVAHFLLLRPLDALVLPQRVYVLAAAMALFSTVIPLFMMAEALRRIGASRVAMISALGPVATVVSGYLGLDEKMSLLQIAGGLLVTLGVLLIVARARETGKKPA